MGGLLSSASSTHRAGQMLSTIIEECYVLCGLVTTITYQVMAANLFPTEVEPKEVDHAMR